MGNKECKRPRQRFIAANTGTGTEGAARLKRALGTAKQGHGWSASRNRPCVTWSACASSCHLPQQTGKCQAVHGAFLWVGASRCLCLRPAPPASGRVRVTAPWLASLCTTSYLSRNVMYSEVYEKENNRTPFSALHVFCKH